MGGHVEHANPHPFFEFQGLWDGSWTAFFFLSLASSRLAPIFGKIGLPHLTGYMLVGVISGPYVLKIIKAEDVENLNYVTMFALSFIAFAAGTHLYLPDLRALFKRIIVIVSSVAATTYILCTLFIWGLARAGVAPFGSMIDGSCALTVSMIAASIMVARSPASAIAVVREVRAKGELTSTFLGITVIGDVVVLILFSLSTSVALAQCSGDGFDVLDLLITVVCLIAALGLGFLVGHALVFLLAFKRIPSEYTVFPLGFFIFLITDWFTLWSLEHWGVSLHFDALLVCIVAGYVVTNQSSNRKAFLTLLNKAGPIIFIPFFTKIGTEINLSVLLLSIGFGALLFVFRGLTIFTASAAGGHFTGMRSDLKYTLWMTLLTQAGVSLGLASKARAMFPSFGSQFQTAIFSEVIFNETLGPVFCAWALKRAGEAGQAAEGDDGHGGHDDEHASSSSAEAPAKRALIVGVTSHSLCLAQRLLNDGFELVVCDTDATHLQSLTALNVPPQPTAAKPVEAVPVPSAAPAADAATAPLVAPSSSSASSSSASPVGLLESRLTNRQLDGSLPLGQALENATVDLDALAPKVTYLFLANDSVSSDVGAQLLKRRRDMRVVVKVHHAEWVPLMAGLGLLPVQEYSALLQVYHKLATTDPRLSLGEQDSNSLPTALAKAVPSHDLDLYLRCLDEKQSSSFLGRHPAPTKDDFNRTKQAWGSMPESLRDEYLDQIVGMHNFRQDVSETVKIERKVTEAILADPDQLRLHTRTASFSNPEADGSSSGRAAVSVPLSLAEDEQLEASPAAVVAAASKSLAAAASSSSALADRQADLEAGRAL